MLFFGIIDNWWLRLYVYIQLKNIWSCVMTYHIKIDFSFCDFVQIQHGI